VKAPRHGIKFWSSGEDRTDHRYFVQPFGNGEQEYEMNNYMLNRLCTLGKMRMSDLKILSSDVRTRFMNEIWQHHSDPDREDNKATPNIMFLLDNKGDIPRVRTATSERYARVWDYDLLSIVDRWSTGGGFRPAAPTINKLAGDDRVALVRGDRDMHTFFYTDRDNGSTDDFGGLRKGLIVRNSEVGDKPISIETFLFREVCSNFLIWGMEEQEVKTRKHIGNVEEFVMDFEDSLKIYCNEIEQKDWDLIELASKTSFASNEEQAIKKLNKRYILPKSEASNIVELAMDEQEGAGDLSIWSVSNGITSFAKQSNFIDESLAYSRKAKSVMREAEKLMVA
jgi:hypothetical protein